MAITKHVDPRRAVAYARGRTRGNSSAAFVWLFAILVGLVILRRGSLPSASEAVTFGLLGGGVVAVGAVAPAPAAAVLVALIVAAVLGVSGALSNTLGRATGAVGAALGGRGQ